MIRSLVAVVAATAFSIAVSAQCMAAEIRILSPGATEAAFNQIIPQFEKASGHLVKVEYGPAGVLADRVTKGERADGIILSAPAIEAVSAHDVIVAGSKVPIAKVGIGVFVQKGAQKPDISSVDAFVRSVTAAKSLAYANPALGGATSILIGKVMDALDTDGSIKAKTKLVAPAKPLLDLIAGGGADFGLNPIAEILPDPRVELVGPLPAPIQKYTEYVYATLVTSEQRDAVAAFAAFLSSPTATAILKSRGFESSED